MIELGKKQELTVIKRVEFGVYLGEQEDAEERVLKRMIKKAKILYYSLPNRCLQARKQEMS